MAERGIPLRDCQDFPGLGAGWYRVSIRLPEDNDRLVEALEGCGKSKDLR